MIHLFRVGMEQHADYDTFLMDGENAFNRLCRAAALKEVRDHFPAGFPFLRAIYGVASTAWHHGGENNIHFSLLFNKYIFNFNFICFDSC